MISQDAIQNQIAKLLPDTKRLLCDLIRFPSTPGNEHDAMLFLRNEFRRLGVETEEVGLSDAIVDDPDYSDPVPDLKYGGRFNLRIVRKGSGGGKSLLLNAHTDVVPPSDGMTDPWKARDEGDTVFGRGACDDKGQIAAIHLALRCLDILGVGLRGSVITHLVVEEENGGNGSLAMTRRGEEADGCIVMESSDGHVYTSIRGAVWFRLVLSGKAGHSGQRGETRSALLMARSAMRILEQYHSKLLKASRGLELFDPYPDPMPITFGKLEAGNWPATAPSRAVLEGVLGFLPNKTKEEVCREMQEALAAGDDSLAGHSELDFMYRHDSSVLEPGHELPRTVLAAAKKAGEQLRIGAMTASCDAWFYNNQLGIPTVVYGPGSLKVAHSKDEQIAMSKIGKAGEVLVRTILDYCGAQL